jgi:hypothetical protein
MFNATCDTPAAQDRLLPPDLLDWFGERTLVELTLEAVCQENSGPRAGLPGPDLLTLLCYCYERGVLGSREIECLAAHDETVRRLCGNACADWNRIRNFRRRNRDCLLRTLQRLFASAYDLRFGDTGAGSGLPQESLTAPSLITESWLFGVTEAGRRIEQAIHIDSMMMDV